MSETPRGGTAGHDAREGTGDPETDPAAMGEVSAAHPDADGGAEPGGGGAAAGSPGAAGGPAGGLPDEGTVDEGAEAGGELPPPAH